MAANPERMPEGPITPPPPLAEVPRFEAPEEAPTRARWERRDSGVMIGNAIGAVLAMVAVPMTWISASTAHVSAWDTPFAFLWQGNNANTSSWTVGRVVMIVAAIGLLAVPLRATNIVRRIAAALIVVGTVLFFVQVLRWNADTIASILPGLGVFAAFLGALLMLVERKRKKAAA